MTAIALPIAGRRVWWLYRLITSGQPAPDRVENVTERLGQAVKTEVAEVLGQKKLLKWSVPGVAHAFVMYAFIILASVYFEAYAVLLSRNPEWNWFIFGNWSVLGFAQDLISVLCLVGLAVFTVIRVKDSPERLGRRSRFSFSHLSGAWITLFMIFNVIWTLFLFRGAVEARDMGTDHGYGKAAFVSYALGKVLPDSTALIGIGLLLHIGVMLVFLVLVLNSKHLHIFIAPLNVMFKRPDGPVALGAVKPMMDQGKPLDFANLDDLDEDTVMGVGKVEDFSWKGLLDFHTCTECGRCQSQCPAWNTDKPLSPKLLVMGLRDHAQAKAPYLLAGSDEERDALPDAAKAEAERELVGATEGYAWEPSGGAVIDPDVLWSCTSCGACVQQCPVDIEHVDHIVDMRRYQVLVESNFPTELNQLFKGLENKGNPWNMSPNARMDWAKGLDFEVKQVGGDQPGDPEGLDEVDWLFWVGCAGAYEDRAKKTTRAVAELLNIAGVDFAVLGNGETCTGDPARRSGNEFVFQQLAMQNAEVLKETKAKKVVSTCAHCFNTLKNEYSQFGVELEVVHHTQLLNRLVREGRLTPVAQDNGAPARSITYHDPCYLGRHNQVSSPPRELLTVIPNAEVKEMPRNSERSFCCGAGGARMWMEENIGERINVNRTTEAVETGADQIAVGCPFCRVMLDDGLTTLQ
ncbi:MAG: (Fe-S)-binding protein, partial [Nocardioidaceae bacterium]